MSYSEAWHRKMDEAVSLATTILRREGEPYLTDAARLARSVIELAETYGTDEEEEGS